MNAPEPQMSAMLRVISYAMVDARSEAVLANRKDGEAQGATLKYIASLMSVTHKIPLKLTNYESWDEATFRKFLKLHDQRFPGKTSLLAVYEKRLALGEKDKPN